ncbi:MAG TPA: LCP family protein [Candidatus Mediterraneibacter cottocaccae]|nr:LCP family protein [Candidatus Mediterraneibacter cottocaccae]
MSKKQRTSDKTGRRSKQRGRSRRNQNNNRFGAVCIILQTILSLAFMAVLMMINILPLKYLSLIAMVLVFLWCITLNTQIARKRRGIAGKVFSLVLVGCLSMGTFYIAQANGVLGMITDGNFQVNNMVVAVLADDPAESIEGAADYNFGVQFERGGDNMQAAITDIQEELGRDINMTEFDSVQDQATALHDGKVEAILYNDAYTDLLEEAFPGYKDSVKIIYQHSIRVELNLGNSSSDDSLTKKPFTVYISGIDVYGDISQTSRSDVNIIAVVNPTTHQVLLVTTPRDYYVEIPGISKGEKDKLTHAGIYGVDASMDTLAELYETEINYYVRLNFTSMIDIVDILGGVDVYSEYEFTTSKDSGYVMDVKKGINHFNGEQALAFSRERQNVPDGDNTRGKDQQAVITAMLKKMLSPTMLLKAGSVMNQVSQNVDTNVSQAQLTGLIRNQLGTNATWTIKSVAAEGTGAKDVCYSSGKQQLYVTKPDRNSIDSIIEEVNIVEEGGILEDAEPLN